MPRRKQTCPQHLSKDWMSDGEEEISALDESTDQPLESLESPETEALDTDVKETLEEDEEVSDWTPSLLPETNVVLESLQNTEVAVAQHPVASSPGSQQMPPAAIQTTLCALQQQQFMLLHVIQQLQSQITGNGGTSAVLPFLVPPLTGSLPSESPTDSMECETSSAPQTNSSTPSLNSTTKNANTSPLSTSTNSTPATIALSSTINTPTSVIVTASSGKQSESGNAAPNSSVSGEEGLHQPLNTDEIPHPTSNEPNTLELLQRHTEQALQNTMSGSSFLINGISGIGSSDFLKFRKDGKEDPSYRHRCRFCGKVFGSDSALQIHIRSHTGERPFKCNVCGNRFSTKGNLKVHFQRHKAKYPHIKMNPHPVPEHLDKFHPPLEPPSGSQSPTPSLTTPPPFAAITGSMSVPAVLLSQSLPAMHQSLNENVKIKRDGKSKSNEHNSIKKTSDLRPASNQQTFAYSLSRSFSPNASNTSTISDDYGSDVDIRKGEMSDGEEEAHDVRAQSPNSPLNLRNTQSVEENDEEMSADDDDKEEQEIISKEEQCNDDTNLNNSESSNDSLISSTSATPTTSCGFPFFPPNFPPYFHPGNFAGSFHGIMPPFHIGQQTVTTTSAAMVPTTNGTTSTAGISNDPTFYQDLLPKPGSTDNSWESLMEIQKASETCKLQQLVDNIEHKLSDPNQCIICHRVLSCKSALQMHYRTHTGERPFKCKICGRAFTTKGNLKTHMGVHRVKPPLRILHQCPVCHKQFTNALVLQQHIRMHTGEPTDIPPEHIMANEIIHPQMLPPSFHRPLLPAFTPHSNPPSGMFPGIPSITGVPSLFTSTATSTSMTIPINTVSTFDKDKQPLKNCKQLNSSQKSPKSEDEEDRQERNSVSPAVSDASNSAPSPAASSKSDASSVTPKNNNPVPQTTGSDVTAISSGNISFSTSLAALENHVKTINSTIPTTMPFGPFSLGLHQFSQYQRFAALSDATDTRSQQEQSSRPSDLSQVPASQERSPVASQAFSPSSMTSKETSFDGEVSADERSSPSSVSARLHEESFSNPASTGALDLTPKQGNHKSSSTPPLLSSSMFPTPFLGLSFPTGRPNTTCQICLKTFACNSALEIHYRSHTKERPFKCSACDRGFSTKGNMKQHMLTHKIRDLPPGLYTTTSSVSNSVTFTTNTNSNASVSSNSNGGVDKTSESKSSPTPNGTGESDEKKCSNSNSSPNSNSSAPKHVCTDCNKPFSSHSALQIHTRTHTGDKPFKCTVCGRAFTTKGNLKVHMGTHMWNNGLSRRGRRMSIDLPNLHITPFHNF